jgi:hypothetical protein
MKSGAGIKESLQSRPGRCAKDEGAKAVKAIGRVGDEAQGYVLGYFQQLSAVPTGLSIFLREGFISLSKCGTT